MSLLLNSGIAHGSPAQAALGSGLSRLSEVRTGRKGPHNAKPKNWNQLPQGVREFRETNPDVHAIPRRYRLRFDDPTEPDHVKSAWHNTTLTFSRFGCSDGWLSLGNHRIEPPSLDFCAETKTYTFQTTVSVPVDGHTEDVAVSGTFSFDSPFPSGSLHVNNAGFAANLQAEPVKYNVEVSANAGARWSSADKKLTWDVKSTEWKNATWDSSAEFAYRTTFIEVDDIIKIPVVENYFKDKSSSPPTEMNLLDPDSHTCTVKDVGGVTTMVTSVSEPKDAPTSREQKSVKSVFPRSLTIEFSSLGDSFKGAYRDKNDRTYAIQGTAFIDLDDDETSSAQFLLSALASRKQSPPVEDIFSFLGQPASQNSHPKVQDTDGLFSALNTKVNLNILAILNNNCMKSDEKDPSKYVDTVAQAAINDFHDIMVYYMDDDLHTLFFGASPPTLIPEVKSIAESDRATNAAFYKKLQVPYLTSILANSRLPEAKKCNGARAEKLLKLIPADDPVYQSQSAALYRFRYLEKFPSTRQFLEDQRDTDHSADIEKITKSRKAKLEKASKGMELTNPNFQKDLAKAKEDIDKLDNWVKERKLYWAYYLLYYVEAVTIPKLYLEYTNGALSPTTAMNLKNLNALFGVMENNQINTIKGATNLMEAFNKLILNLQMTSLVPQLVDVDSASDFDPILKASLEAFWHKYEHSSDPNLVEHAAHAKQLYESEKLRRNFLEPLKKAVRLGGSSASWTTALKMWEDLVTDTKWFKALAGGSKMFTFLGHLAAAIIIFLPLIPGYWDTMSTADKIYWGGATALATGIFVVKAAQGLFRLAYMWKDISSLGDAFKCIAGRDLLNNMVPSASKIPGTFARYFTRTAQQTADLSILEAEVATSEKELFSFSRLSRMFGRNMGELLGSVLGTVLAVGSLVLTSVSLAKEKEPALIAIDVLMILSASIQILTIAAGWVLASGVALSADALSALTLVAAWGGPVAIAFALLGIIAYIVWTAKNPPKDPVEEFVNSRVKAAGLYMDYQAIDYFAVVAATDTTPSRVGVSIRGSSTFPSERVYLRLEASGPKTGSLKYTKEPDFTPATVWSLQTDGYGQTQIYTHKYFQVKDSEGRVTRSPSLWFLSVSDDGASVIVRTLPSKTDDKGNHNSNYDRELKFTYWTANVVANPEVDPISKTPISALCDLSYKTSNGVIKHLVLQSDPSTKTPIKLALVSDPRNTSTTRYVSNWMVQYQSLGPQPFHYTRNPWKLFLTDTDSRNLPIFEDTLAVSSGYKWSITPDLPNFLELVTSANPASDEGMIRVVKGKTLGKMAQKTYTVQCKLIMSDGQVHGVQKTTVDIAVVDESEEIKSESSGQ